MGLPAGAQDEGWRTQGRRAGGVVRWLVESIDESEGAVLLKQIGAITIAAVLGTYALAYFAGTRTPNLVRDYASWSLIALFLIAMSSIFAYALSLIARGDPHPLPKVVAKFRAYFHPAVLADRAGPIVLVFAFLGAFSIYKSQIPWVHAFAWDAAFSDLDRMIFGTDPWRITHAFIGPRATRFIDFAYIMWVPVFTCVVFYHSVFAKGEAKARFFLSFFGGWIILGIICAMIFSSAGPCFLQLIGHPYAERYPIFPLEYGQGSQRIMDYLAEGYRTGDFGTAKGISAMPSMHIAVVTLYVATARKIWTKAISLAYFLLIFVGSIHLGWHYAADGIFAALGMLAIYTATSLATPKRRQAIPAKVSYSV